LGEGRDYPDKDRGDENGRALEFTCQFVHFFLSVDPQPLRRKSHAGNKRLGN
jgi:hypothetical protein